MYKIVHRTYGSTPYFPESLEEAEEMLELMVLLKPEYRTQYYIRKL